MLEIIENNELVKLVNTEIDSEKTLILNNTYSLNAAEILTLNNICKIDASVKLLPVLKLKDELANANIHAYVSYDGETDKQITLNIINLNQSAFTIEAGEIGKFPIGMLYAEDKIIASPSDELEEYFLRTSTTVFSNDGLKIDALPGVVTEIVSTYTPNIGTRIIIDIKE